MNRALRELARTTGRAITGTSSATRLTCVAAGLVLGWLGPAASAVPTDVTVKLGGSGISNWSKEARQGTIGLRQLGGHLSVDVATQRDGHIMLSPYIDVYHRLASGDRPRTNMSTAMLTGVNLIFFPVPRGDNKVTMYLGGGGGIARMKVTAIPVAGEATTAYKIRAMADGLMGLEVKVQKRTSLFLQAQYLVATKMLNGVSAHAGVAFHLYRDTPATAAHTAVPAYTPAAPVSRPAPPPRAPAQVVAPAKVVATYGDSLGPMSEMIYFARDASELDDAATSILADKVAFLRANPTTRVLIVGYASQPGTDAYNMALGLRRSQAAKAFLISRGIDQKRIEVATRGEGQLVVDGPGEVANAQNRRDQFLLLIPDPPAPSTR